MKRFCLSHLILVTVTAGCGRTSPTAPSPPVPVNFQGRFAGAYSTTGCVETVVVGLCRGLGLDASATLPLTLSFSQTDTSVTGPMLLGVTPPIVATLGTSTARATFEGTVQSDHLRGMAVFASVPYCVMAPTDPRLPRGGGFGICGLGVNDRITAWDATIAGGALSGSFSWTINYPGATLLDGAELPASSATVTANLVQVTRQ
jgi:hypothetical protein